MTRISTLVLLLSAALAVAASLPRHHRQQSRQCSAIFPQLTWLRDAAIEKIFGPNPQTSDQSVILHKTGMTQTNGHLSPSVLTKYASDVVLRFELATAREEKALAQAADMLILDVWEFNQNFADIRLSRNDVPILLGLLPASMHTAYSNLIPDLERMVYRSYPSASFKQAAYIYTPEERLFTPRLGQLDDGGADNIFFRDYQPLSVIVPWMKLMTSLFTTHVRMITIGTSYEGRDIMGLRVGVRPPINYQEKPRKTILIAGGAHAREWVSVSTVTYVAWSLITSYGKSPAITKLLHEFDFVFVPTLNPDGYVYTWENDRLWRKNRQETNLRFCRGMDLDRGFGFAWDGTTFQDNPCSESYPGKEPFQAVESHRLASWAKNETENNNVKLIGFLDLHSYSQQVLYPFSYSCTAVPRNQENLEELATGLAKAIRLSSGEYYEVQSACEGSVPFTTSGEAEDVGARMGTGGGSAMDWFYHEMGVRFAYQIKLRDTGAYGFLLPKEHIVPVGKEAFGAVKYFGDFLLGDNGIERDVPLSEARQFSRFRR